MFTKGENKSKDFDIHNVFEEPYRRSNKGEKFLTPNELLVYNIVVVAYKGIADIEEILDISNKLKKTKVSKAVESLVEKNYLTFKDPYFYAS